MKKKWMLYALAVLLSIPCLLLAILSLTAKAPDAGLVEGRLRPCPSTPNCVCSEDEDTPASIEPLAFEASAEAAWDAVKEAVQAMGGQIEKDDGDYLHAAFTSTLFRFVDDLELRLDEEARVIHVRSASRAGHSDLGVNRKRVEELRRRSSQI